MPITTLELDWCFFIRWRQFDRLANTLSIRLMLLFPSDCSLYLCNGWQIFTLLYLRAGMAGIMGFWKAILICTLALVMLADYLFRHGAECSWRLLHFRTLTSTTFCELWPRLPFANSDLDYLSNSDLDYLSNSDRDYLLRTLTSTTFRTRTSITFWDLT